MGDLKPCPFCGGEVKHQLMLDGSYSFNCYNCGLDARFPEDFNFSQDDLKLAESKWNTRYEKTDNN